MFGQQTVSNETLHDIDGNTTINTDYKYATIDDVNDKNKNETEMNFDENNQSDQSNHNETQNNEINENNEIDQNDQINEINENNQNNEIQINFDENNQSNQSNHNENEMMEKTLDDMAKGLDIHLQDEESVDNNSRIVMKIMKKEIYPLFSLTYYIFDNYKAKMHNVINAILLFAYILFGSATLYETLFIGYHTPEQVLYGILFAYLFIFLWEFIDYIPLYISGIIIPCVYLLFFVIVCIMKKGYEFDVSQILCFIVLLMTVILDIDKIILKRMNF